MFEPCKTDAMLNSTGKKQKVFIVKYDDMNHCKAIIDNKLCTAVYNPFSGLFYVDDKFGVIDYIEPQDIKNGKAESE